MDMFLFFIGFLVFVSSIFYLIVSLIKKKYKKKTFVIMLCGGLVLCIVGLSMGISSDAEDIENPSASTSDQKSKEEKEAAEQKQFEEEEKTFGYLLADDKTYAAYTDDEKREFYSLTVVGRWNLSKEGLSKEEAMATMEKFDSLSSKFKDKYKTRYNLIKAEYDTVKYDTGITWEDIARNGMNGKFCKFEGTIIQILNGEGYKQYRVAINDDYDKIMLVEIKDGLVDTNLLEDDVIFFKGYSYGNVTYKTVLGAEQTIPAVVAEHVELK